MGAITTEAVKLLLICIVTAIVCFTVKGISPAFAVAVAVAGGLIVVINLLGWVSSITQTVENAAQKAGISGEVVNFAIKGVGLAWLTGFASDTARGVGEEGVAKKAELAGKISVLLLCVPVMESVFGDIAEMFSGF